MARYSSSTYRPYIWLNQEQFILKIFTLISLFFMFSLNSTGVSFGTVFVLSLKVMVGLFSLKVMVGFFSLIVMVGFFSFKVMVGFFSLKVMVGFLSLKGMVGFLQQPTEALDRALEPVSDLS